MLTSLLAAAHLLAQPTSACMPGTDLPARCGTIRVYEVSAMDGSEINVVNIPVTLTA